MIYVTFVCHGNICRSPMAEIIFANMVEEEGLAIHFCITSYGTSNEEEGHPIYPEARKALNDHGIDGTHRAKQISLTEIINCDFLLVMDSANLQNIMAMTRGRYSEKIFRLCDFTSNPRDVSDPWYTRNFEKAYADITEGCRGFLEYVKNEIDKNGGVFNGTDKLFPL